MVVANRNNIEMIPLGDTVSFPSPPTIDQINALYDSGIAFFRQFHSNCEKMYEYYYLRNSVRTPDGFDPIRPATIRALIDDLTAHVDINNLEIDVPDTPRTKARAEKLKKFYIGAWLQVSPAVRRAAVQNAAAFGIGFWKVMFEPEMWPDAPVMEEFGVEGTGGNVVVVDESGYREALSEWQDKRSISYPIKVQSVSPRNLIWDTARSGSKWFIEFYERPKREILQRYPQWVPKADNSDVAEWREYWDDTYVVYMAGGDIVYGPHRHGYGFPPYQAVDPAATVGWTDGPPEDRWQGIAAPILNIYDAMARHLTMYESVMRQHAYPVHEWSGPENLARRAMDDWQPSAGKAYRPSGVARDVVQPVPPPQELIGLYSFLLSEVEQATFPSVVRGQRPAGVSAGFPISVLAGLGRLKFQPYADATATAMASGNIKFAKLVENKIRGRITVRARTEVHEFDQAIEPSDIRGYYENSVKLKAEAPEEREREALLAMRLYQSLPGFPLVEALKRAGIANPLEAIMQRRAEDVSQLMMPQQAERALAVLGGQFTGQLFQSAGTNTGNQFLPGQTQLQRPGERNIQQARSASQQGRPSVFPEGEGGLDILGSLLGAAPGGRQGVPSGQTV